MMNNYSDNITRQPRLATPQQVEVIKKILNERPALSKYKVSDKIKSEYPNLYIGPTGVYKVIKRLGLNKVDARISLAVSQRYHLTPEIRKTIVDQIISNNINIYHASRKFGVSRPTIYKWLGEYEKNRRDDNFGFKNRRSVLTKYHNQVSEKYEDIIKQTVKQLPYISKYTIADIINTKYPQYSLSPTGVYKVLTRMNLNTPEQRVSWASVVPGEVVFGERILSFGKAFVLTTVFTAAFVFSTTWWLRNVLVHTGSTPIGLVFASLALLMGSLFFLYSIKYYLTLAVVLSFNQSETVKEQESKSKAMGLKPNLDNIVLTKYPFISIHIPLFNEKNVVERAIKAAANFEYGEPASTRGESTRGRYEVILADDSTDETTDIIDNYLKQFNGSSARLPAGQVKQDQYTLTTAEVRPGVTVKHLHRSTRSGFKGGALSLALQLTDPRAEFISVFDADFVPYPDTLTLFLKYFEASKKSNDHVAAVQPFDSPSTSLVINAQGQHLGNNIAAVQGYQWHVLNKSENWITRGVRSEYAGSYVIERSGEEIYGGLKQISGSVYMIRKDILQSIGWGTSITEDFELTLKLYEKGYKVLYTPYIQAPSECVSTLKRLIRQRMRWAEGHSFNIRKTFFHLLFGRWADGENLKLQTQNSKLQLKTQSFIQGNNRTIEQYNNDPSEKQGKVWLPSPLSFSEKLEFLYLSPYYLQAAFFLLGTISWLISETVFQARLPFWTTVWGWSLVLTNMLSLPLMNLVGLFLEEAEERDFEGIFSFVLLSYLLVPFQA